LFRDQLLRQHSDEAGRFVIERAIHSERVVQHARAFHETKRAQAVSLRGIARHDGEVEAREASLRVAGEGAVLVVHQH
jgi:hypothetical protein